MAEESRKDYGPKDLDAKGDLKFNTEEMRISDTTTSYAELLKNPASMVFEEVNKIYLRNEQHAFELFNQTQDLQNNYKKLINSNLPYQTMPIITVANGVIDGYINWSIAARHSTFIIKSMLERLEKIIREQYKPKTEFEEQIDLIQKNYEDLKREEGEVVEVKAWSGTKGVLFNAALVKKLGITEGDKVIVRKALF